jgi:hypothetical protein
MLVLLVVVSFFPPSFLSISGEKKEKYYQHLSRLFVIKRPSFKCPVHIGAQQKGAAFSAVLQSPTATKLDAKGSSQSPIFPELLFFAFFFFFLLKPVFQY